MKALLVWREGTGEIVLREYGASNPRERLFSGTRAARDWAEIVQWESSERIAGSDPFGDEEEMWQEIRDAEAVLKFLDQWP